MLFEVMLWNSVMYSHRIILTQHELWVNQYFIETAFHPAFNNPSSHQFVSSWCQDIPPICLAISPYFRAILIYIKPSDTLYFLLRFKMKPSIMRSSLPTFPTSSSSFSFFPKLHQIQERENNRQINRLLGSTF